MPIRKFLQVPIITREDKRAIERVSKALHRSKADTARFLFREMDKRIGAIKRTGPSIPDAVTAQLTDQGEAACK